MKTVNCEGVEYLVHESEGNAARWIMPMAQYYCKGAWGLDIGCSKPEWKFPNAIPVDPLLPNEFNKNDAMNLPESSTGWDYIFSSHCLEHVKENWMNVLDYWLTKIKVGGILFLYLPHASQNYWQPRNNRKHIHSFTGQEINDYLLSLGHQSFVSGVDMNHSFTVICEKKEQEPEFGTQAYYNKKAKVFADDLEEALIKQGRTYFRDGDNVVFNGPNPLDNDRVPVDKIVGGIQYGVPDAHGDVLMPGCFDKSINSDNKYVLKSHLNMIDEQREQALKDGESFMKEFKEASKGERTPFKFTGPIANPNSYPDCKPKCGWYDKNTNDLADKIADMRMGNQRELILRFEFESLLIHINDMRALNNISPMTMDEFKKMHGLQEDGSINSKTI